MQLDYTILWLGFLFCLLAYTALGLMLENKRLGYLLEILRLATMLVSCVLLISATDVLLPMALLCGLSALWLANLAPLARNSRNITTTRE